jgi:hypothetical protein
MAKRGLTTGDPAEDSVDLALALRYSGNATAAPQVRQVAGLT